MKKWVEKLRKVATFGLGPDFNLIVMRDAGLPKRVTNLKETARFHRFYLEELNTGCLFEIGVWADAGDVFVEISG